MLRATRYADRPQQELDLHRVERKHNATAFGTIEDASF